MSKTFKIFKKAFIGIILFLIVAVLGVIIYFRAPVHSYYKISKKGFVTPDSNKNYIAQGISYDSASDNFYLTGYMKNGSASPIYIVNKKTKKLVNSVKMANPDGSDFVGHAGGLSVMNGKIYIAGGDSYCLYVFDKNDVDSAPEKSYVKYNDIVSLKTQNDNIRTSFTTSNENIIYAGEFHRNPSYITNDSHKVSFSGGEQYALAVGFELLDNIAVPKVAYSIPDNIQGMCFGEDGIYLTSSWGPAFSHVYKYLYSDIKQQGSKEVCGTEVPLYILSKENLSKDYKIAPMAEEIELVDGLYYISNESASNKYIFGKFTGGKWCLGSKF